MEEIKKKDKTVLIVGSLAAVAVAGIVVFSKKDDIVEKVEENIELIINKVKINVNFPNTTIPITYQVKNENIVGATEVQFEGNIYVQGIFLGAIPTTSPIDIQPKKTTPQNQMEVKINLIQLAASVDQIIKKNGLDNLKELDDLSKVEKIVVVLGKLKEVQIIGRILSKFKPIEINTTVKVF